MKTVAIFSFSGTGNTEIVAELICEGLTGRQYNAELIKIEDVLKGTVKPNIDHYDLIGIGCPVIGFGVPVLVNKFLKGLPLSAGKKVFIFRTAGGVAPINYNASNRIYHLLKKKKYDVFYERIFSIGSNWTVRFSDDIVKQLYQATKEKVSVMCGEITEGKERKLKTGLKLKLTIGILGLIFPQFLRLTGKDLKANNNCTTCGKCIQKCPAGNIYLKNGVIKFKMSCSSCLRCVYNCPSQAIEFKTLRSFKVEGGYQIHKVLDNPLDENSYNNGKESPQFFKEYLENINL